MAAKRKAPSDGTVAVTCGKCHKSSEIMTPAIDHGTVVWKCPAPVNELGIDLCGHTNIHEPS